MAGDIPIIEQWWLDKGRQGEGTALFVYASALCPECSALLALQPLRGLVVACPKCEAQLTVIVGPLKTNLKSIDKPISVCVMLVISQSGKPGLIFDPRTSK